MKRSRTKQTRAAIVTWLLIIVLLLPNFAWADTLDADAVIADIQAAQDQISFAAGDSIGGSVSHNFTVPVGPGPNGSTYLWSESSDYLSINQTTGLVTVTRPTSGPVWGAFVTFALTATKNESSDFAIYEIRIPLDTDPVIVFADPVLSNRLTTIYDTNDDDTLTQSEVDAITSITSAMLWLPAPQTITDLSGIEACHNLETLDLSYYENTMHWVESEVTSLAPLSGLTQLKSLTIEGDNQETNIDAVFGLPSLINLTLKKLNISNIERFYDLRNQLETLDLSQNPINDSDTADCIHLLEKDFSVGANDFEVWIPATDASADLQDVLSDLSWAQPTYAFGDSDSHVSENLTLPLAGPKETTITWSATSGDFIINAVTGAVTLDRPTDADAPFTLTAIVSKNGTTRQKDLALILKKLTPLDEEVIIADPVLRSYLLKEYDQDHDGKLSKEEALEITSISANQLWLPTAGQTVESLLGLEECENLRTLDLTYFTSGGFDVTSEVTSLEPIADLTKLETLGVYGSLTDLSDLLNLTNLNHLTILNDGTACNIAAIFSLTKLSILSLGSMQLSTVAGFENFHLLSSLSLYGNQIKDIEPISFLAYQLNNLDLRNNPLNNEMTAGCYHKVQSDFVVNSKIYQVWVEGTETSDPELDEVVVFDDLVLKQGLLTAFD